MKFYDLALVVLSLCYYLTEKRSLIEANHVKITGVRTIFEQAKNTNGFRFCVTFHIVEKM